MQLVSWATLLMLLVSDLAEMRSPDAAAAVRKDRLHPRQGNVALDPQGPPLPDTHTPSPPPRTRSGAGTPQQRPLSFS